MTMDWIVLLQPPFEQPDHLRRALMCIRSRIVACTREHAEESLYTFECHI